MLAIQQFYERIYLNVRRIGCRRFSSTSGFTQAGVYARRKFCGNLEVYRPPEPLWNPRLREAATTLAAILADSVATRSKFVRFLTCRENTFLNIFTFIKNKRN